MDSHAAAGTPSVKPYTTTAACTIFEKSERQMGTAAEPVKWR